MHAMLLAAGLGRRLAPLTDELPKPAVPVLHRPLGAYALDHLVRSGATRIVVNTHHLAEAVERSLRPHCPREIELVFLHEATLLGTGGALRNAAPHLESDPVLVMNADLLYAPDFAAALALHRSEDAVATMILRRDADVARYGAIEVDGGGRVRRILGEPAHAGALEPLMFSGASVLSRRAFRDFPAEGCVIRSAYRGWMERAEAVAGAVDETPWRDLGTPRSYLDTNLELASGALTWPGVDPGSAIHPTAKIGPRANVRGSVVGPHAEVAADVTVEGCVLWPHARVTTSIRGLVVTPRERVTA